MPPLITHLKVSREQVCVEPPRSSALNVTLPAFAAERTCSRYAAIDRYRPKQQTRRLPLSIGGTDRWTDIRPLHRLRSAYADSVSKRRRTVERTLTVVMLGFDLE